MKPTKLLIGCFALTCAIVSSLYADPMQVLLVQLHYKRSTSELTLVSALSQTRPLPLEKSVRYPAFLVQTRKGDGHLVNETRISSPLVAHLSLDDEGNPPLESIIEEDENIFTVFFPYSGNEAIIEVYELQSKEDENAVLLGSIELP